MDTFTIDDRRELMRVGMQIDELLKQMSEAKITWVTQDQRITSLETTRTQLQIQMKTSLWWMSIIAAAVGSAAHFLLHMLGK